MKILTQATMKRNLTVNLEDDNDYERAKGVMLGKSKVLEGWLWKG